jgi:hypothetical protein
LLPRVKAQVFSLSLSCTVTVPTYANTETIKTAGNLGASAVPSTTR